MENQFALFSKHRCQVRIDGIRITDLPHMCIRNLYSNLKRTKLIRQFAERPMNFFISDAWNFVINLSH